MQSPKQSNFHCSYFQVELDRLKTSTTLTDLSSQTLYNVKVVAVYDEGESLPANAEAVTRKLFLITILVRASLGSFGVLLGWLGFCLLVCCSRVAMYY